MPLPLYKIMSRLLPPAHPHPTPNNSHHSMLTLHPIFEHVPTPEVVMPNGAVIN